MKLILYSLTHVENDLIKAELFDTILNGIFMAKRHLAL